MYTMVSNGLIVSVLALFWRGPYQKNPCRANKKPPGYLVEALAANRAGVSLSG